MKLEEAIETVLKELETLKEKELDYTTVYMNGVYDEQAKWKKKIEEKITHYNKRLEEDEILDWIVKDKIIINVLQELLKEEN